MDSEDERRSAKERKARSIHTAELQVGGMDCPTCVAAIESGLSRLPGVDSVEVDLETGCVLVGHHDGVHLNALERSIEELGFRVGEGAGEGEVVAHRPFISAPLVLAVIAVSLPLLVLFRDALPYMGGQNTLFTPGGLDTETFGQVQLLASGFAVGLVVVNAAVGALFGGGGKVAIRFFGENLATWNLLIAVALIPLGLILLRV